MKNKIFIKKETMRGIADAIRAKDGTTEEIAVTDMAQRIAAIKSGGMAAVENASVIQLWSLNDLGAAKSELHLKNTNTLFCFCYNSNANQTERQNVTVEEFIITCDQKITNAQFFLSNPRLMPDTKLRKVTLFMDLSNATNIPWFISYCSALEEIDGTPIDLSSATKAGNFFYDLPALREARFQGVIACALDVGGAPMLSAESIENIISCLSGSTSGLALTLSAAAVNAAFETAEGAGDGSASTEWAELIATKSNWTISLA